MRENIRGRRVVRFDLPLEDQEIYTEVYNLCDGRRHLRIDPSKIGDLDEGISSTGECDIGSPHGQPIDPYDLEPRIQYELGMGLDRRFHHYGLVSPNGYNDSRITQHSPNILESDRHIMEWDEAVVITKKRKKSLVSVFGDKPFDRSMPKPAPLRILQVRRKLKQMGLSRSRRIAVLAWATPRYAIAAAAWGQAVREQINRSLTPDVLRDQIFSVLQTFCLCPSLGREKAERSLRGFGIEPPPANTERAFFLILEGAKEILALDDPYLMFT